MSIEKLSFVELDKTFCQMAGQKTPILPPDKPPRVEVTVCKFALEQSQNYILAKISKE